MDEEVGGHHDVMLPYHHDAHTGHDHDEEGGHHHDVCHLVLVDEAAVILIVKPERPLQLLLCGLRREKLKSLQARKVEVKKGKPKKCHFFVAWLNSLKSR